MLLLAVSGLARYIDPNVFSLPALVTLATPIIIIVNIALLVYWIIMWDRTAIVMAVLLVLFGGHFSRHYRLNIHKEIVHEKVDLRIMTYNVGVFQLGEKKIGNTLDSVIDLVNRYNPDILCLQEFRTTKAHDLGYINQRFNNLRYRYVRYFPIRDDETREYGSGLAIYSRYKLLNGHAVAFPNSSNGAIYADAVIRKDTLRIFNLHLQTSSVNAKEVYDLNDPDVPDKAKNMVKNLRNYNNKRARQAERIAEIAEASPYANIICGDFNDTPGSYTYRTVRGRYTDAFVAKGSGVGYTFNSVFPILRIDNVFVDGGKYKVAGYESPNLPFSDHNPVIVELNRKK